MDVRRIDLLTRALDKQRPWQRTRISRATMVVAFLFPYLLLSLALVPASQVPNMDHLKLSSFVQNHALRVTEVPAVLPIITPATTMTLPPAPATTVTTPAPAPVATPSPSPAPTPATVVDTSSAASWASSSGVECIREHESGDDYSTDTGNGYYGAYQDSLSTWESHGGTGLPSDASPAVQDQINYEIWLSGGWGQWSTAGMCGL